MGYLVIKNKDTKKTYNVTSTCDRPRLAVKNNGKTNYIPIHTNREDYENGGTITLTRASTSSYDYSTTYVTSTYYDYWSSGYHTSKTDYYNYPRIALSNVPISDLTSSSSETRTYWQNGEVTESREISLVCQRTAEVYPSSPNGQHYVYLVSYTDVSYYRTDSTVSRQTKVKKTIGSTAHTRSSSYGTTNYTGLSNNLNASSMRVKELFADSYAETLQTTTTIVSNYTTRYVAYTANNYVTYTYNSMYKTSLDTYSDKATSSVSYSSAEHAYHRVSEYNTGSPSVEDHGHTYLAFNGPYSTSGTAYSSANSYYPGGEGGSGAYGTTYVVPGVIRSTTSTFDVSPRSTSTNSTGYANYTVYFSNCGDYTFSCTTYENVTYYSQYTKSYDFTYATSTSINGTTNVYRTSTLSTSEISTTSSYTVLSYRNVRWF